MERLIQVLISLWVLLSSDFLNLGFDEKVMLYYGALRRNYIFCSAFYKT